MEAFGECHEAWLRTFLELSGGLPSEDTFRRVFNALDPRSFQECSQKALAGSGMDLNYLLKVLLSGEVPKKQVN